MLFRIFFENLRNIFENLRKNPRPCEPWKFRYILTYLQIYAIIIPVLEKVPGENHKRWRLLPFTEGSEILFSPFNLTEGGDNNVHNIGRITDDIIFAYRSR